MNTFKASDFDDLFGITPEQRTSVSQQPTDTQTTQLPAAEQQSFKVNPSAIKASDFDDLFGITPEDRISVTQKQKAIAEDSSDFIAGTKRGVQNLQASLYGATGLVGKGLQSIGAEETGKKLQDFGFEGYRRNTAEAAQTPAKYSFKDIYTGKAGIGGAIDWAQGTLGELVPSMVEAATGAVVGSFAAPGAGTVVGGLAGRTVLKKSIDQAVGKLVKEGADAAVANQVRKQVTTQALKKLGGKVGMGAAVMPMEAGGMYGELFESHGVDAPETALLFGALATSLEFLGGNSKLVDVFVDSLAKGAKGTAKKSAKEILSNIPEEALQEGGQELMNILNTVVNTDEKLLTLDNVERIVESMAAGAVGGSFGSAANVVMDGKQLNKPSELDQKVDNIASGGVENIQKALNEFDRQDAFNIELLNNPEKLAAQAAEFGVTPERLSDNIGSQIIANKQLRERLNIELAKPVEEVKPVNSITDEVITAKINDLRIGQEDRNRKINDLNNQTDKLRKQFYKLKEGPEKEELKNQIISLLSSRNALISESKQTEQKIKDFAAPKKSDEIRAELQDFYDNVWSDKNKNLAPGETVPAGIQSSYAEPEKIASESAEVISNKYNQIDPVRHLRNDGLVDFTGPKTTDELLAERQRFANEVWANQYGNSFRPEITEKEAKESAEFINDNYPEVKARLDQLFAQIDQETNNARKQQLQKIYDDIFSSYTPIKSAEESAKVFEEQLGTSDESSFKNEQQDRLSAEQKEALDYLFRDTTNDQTTESASDIPAQPANDINQPSDINPNTPTNTIDDVNNITDNVPNVVNTNGPNIDVISAIDTVTNIDIPETTTVTETTIAKDVNVVSSAEIPNNAKDLLTPDGELLKKYAKMFKESYVLGDIEIPEYMIVLDLIAKKDFENLAKVAKTIEANKSTESDPMYARTSSFKAKANAELRRIINLIGAQMYQNNLVEVTIKETVQNSFDAVKASLNTKGAKGIKDGRIDITVDPTNRIVAIRDNGQGMSKETILKAFLTIAGTDKTGVKEGDASGSFGFAKAAFLFGTEWLSANTVRDGKRYTFKTTGDELLGDGADIVTENAEKNDHGTILVIKIPETVSVDGKDNYVWFPNEIAEIDFFKQPLLHSDVEINLQKTSLSQEDIDNLSSFDSPVWGHENFKPLKTGKHSDLSGYEKNTSIHFDWGDADLYISKERINDKWEIKHDVLSAGVFQFNYGFKIGDYEKVPYNIILNIFPKVKADAVNYPFNLRREGWKDVIKEDIKTLDEYIKNIALGTEAEKTVEQFKNIKSLPKIEINDLGTNNVDITDFLTKRPIISSEETKIKPVTSLPNITVSGGQVIGKNEFGDEVIFVNNKEDEKIKGSFKADKELPKAKDFLIDVGIDDSQPIFHNNTTTDFIDLANQHGYSAETFFAELGSIMLKVRDVVAERAGYGYQNLRDKDKSVFTGISIDKKYHGVNIVIPFEAVLLNPLAVKSRTLPGLVALYYDTIIHEFTHVAQRNHNESFITAKATLDNLIAADGTDLEIRVALGRVLKKHQPLINLLQGEYERSTTKNIAKSFKDSGDSDAIASWRISDESIGNIKDGNTERVGTFDSTGRQSSSSRVSGGAENYSENVNFDARQNISETKKLSLADISKIFPNQEVTQDISGKISIRFKNGQGATFQSIEDAGQGYIKFAIETGQMSKNGKILGITVGSDVLLDANFADNQTLWHENKHVLDNLGLITKEDDSLLNAEFNRLRNANKLRFSLSTHEDPRQRMIENRANTFAQIMLDREAYRNKPLGKTIQRILDFFQQLLSLGQQSVAGFAREVESGKIYERQAYDNAFPVMKKPMFTFAGIRATTAESDKMFKAQKMRNSGFSREAIWNNTGWWEIVPGSDIWSFEIDDSKSVWNLELFNKAVNKIEQDIEDRPNKTLSTKLSNLFTHPDLFNQYPFLKDIKVILDHRLEGRGAYDEKNQRIHISTKQVANQETDFQEPFKGVILHEIQHAIQAHEGFARGGNSKQQQKIVENQFALRKLKKIVPTIKNPLDKESIEELIITIQKELEKGKINEVWPNYLKELADYFKQNNEFYAAKELSTDSASEFWGSVRYQSLTGEAQARLTSFRQQMNADKRKMIPPWVSLKQMLTNENLLLDGKNPEDILISQDANGIAMSEEGSLSDRLNADQIATTPEQIAQTIHPAIMYDGLMKGIPGVVDDLHNFTITLPDGKQPSFSITGEVTADKVSDQLNKLMERFGQDPNFEVRDFTVPEQKLSDEQYNESFRHQNNLLQDVKQIFRMRLHDIKLLADKSMGSISTRLKNVSPLLSSKLRILDFTTSQKIVKALREAKPILEATKGMSKEDKFVWDLARKNADAGKVQQLATKYGILENVQTLRNTLNNIRKEAEEVGYDVGFLDEYWPRIIKDTEGFLQATQEISEQPVFSNAIKEKAKAMGLTVEQFNNEYPEVKADIISNLILGRGMGIGGPGNIQSRVYDTIPRELEQYYMDSDAALMQYIYSMTKKIEVRKFFGKVPERIMKLKTAKKNKQTELIKLQELARLNPAEAEINAEKIEQLQEDIARIDEPLEQYKHRRDYTENIGTYIDDLMMAGILNKKDEKMVRDILDARFHEYGTHGPINAYKNFSYIDVMGSPISAITQIGDLAWAMYVGKVWTPSGFSNTIKNIINAAFNKSNITKEDLGIERIAQEFADGTTLSNAVSWVFNKTGLSKIDSIGKEALINNALDQYKRQVQSEAGRTKLISDIRATFGPQSESVIQDLLTNNNSDNVKMLLYSRLLDFQPVALSEMPEYYLKAGNGRVFYMLKTYTLKQMDVFRKEVWHTIKNGDAQQKLEGIKNLVQLMSLLTLANAGADEIKDWLLGKESKFKDHVIENFLTMGGASRYMRMQATQDGLGSTLAGKILPPFKFINSLSKDIIQGYKDYVSGDASNLTDSRVLESVPIAGKLLYWHMGRGAEYKESIAEQEFKKAGKAANLFKKQLENSKDKRLFLQANLNDFRQMKLHENSQSSLNKIQATINKLEKIEQTTNVVKRIGQLNNHKERIMIDYLKRAEGLTAQ